MISTKTWNYGDKVVHTGKPEWGHGLITNAAKTLHDGQPCQSLTIRFDRAGIKTISTAFANLIEAKDAPSLPYEGSGRAEGPGSVGSAEHENGEAPFGAPTVNEIKAQMVKLPEAATDPFTTAIARLKATLGLYKFTPTGASLLDWAAIQSGLSDPMSRFNRHELEKFFESFVIVRDQHMKKVLQEARKADPAGAAQAVSQAPPVVQHTLRRLDTMR